MTIIVIVTTKGLCRSPAPLASALALVNDRLGSAGHGGVTVRGEASEPWPELCCGSAPTK